MSVQVRLIAGEVVKNRGEMTVGILSVICKIGQYYLCATLSYNLC